MSEERPYVTTYLSTAIIELERAADLVKQLAKYHASVPPKYIEDLCEAFSGRADFLRDRESEL